MIVTDRRALQIFVKKHQPVSCKRLPDFDRIRGLVLRMLYDGELVLDRDVHLRIGVTEDEG